MKYNLETLYNFMIKHYPEIEGKAQSFLAPYCIESNNPDNTESGYYYGFNSLKWLIYTIRDMPEHDNPKVFNVFFGIVTEHFATDRNNTDLQHKILSYKSAYPYKEVKQSYLPSPADLPFFSVGGFLFCVNDTQHAITSRIFKQTRADAILFRNEEIRSAGIVYRVVSPINKFIEKKSVLFTELSKYGQGWSAVIDPNLNQVNLIINPGLKNESGNSFTDITTDEFINIVKNAYQ